MGGQKIYNSAVKLFSLSKFEPVGAMVYGNAEILNVPWELLIKTYRSKLGARRFETLQEYRDDLFTYLSTSTKFFPEAEQDQWALNNVRGYYELILNEFLSRVHMFFEQSDQIEEAEAQALFSDIVSNHCTNLKALNLAYGFAGSDEKLVKKRLQPEFKKIRTQTFEKLKISGKTASQLYEIATYIQTREKFSTQLSGLVIAGYGGSEVYPEILAYDIEGVIENKIKFKKNKEKSFRIENGSDCAVAAFAQDDMVQTFMNGINPYLSSYIGSYLAEIFKRAPDLFSFSRDLAPEQQEQIKHATDELTQSFFKNLSDHIREQQAQPVLRMVKALPKDEIADMAEALVNLTAFKRKITESMETVGGPIDVVVISKGDGLIWVKRKNYFDPALNQHFFANYFRSNDYETE